MVDTPTVPELAKKAYLRPQQRVEVETDIREAETLLREYHALSRLPGVEINVDNVEKQLQLNRETLQLGVPQDYDGTIKNRLFRVMKSLEQSISYDMPTADDMEYPTPNNIDRHMAWESTHKDEILAWRNIRKILDSTNDGPNFTNIETLRSNTAPKGDPRRYWRGFENMQWADDIEDDLVADIGDEEYLTFLELRAAQWAKVNILRKLGWNDRRYAAAVERFRRSGVITDSDASNLLVETAESFDPDAPVAQTWEVEAGTMSQRGKSKKASTSKSSAAPPKPKRNLIDSDKWPMPQCRERNMDVGALSRLSSISTIRMTNACLSEKRHKEWSDAERQRLEAALVEWDQAHAFAQNPSAGPATIPEGAVSGDLEMVESEEPGEPEEFTDATPA